MYRQPIHLLFDQLLNNFFYLYQLQLIKNNVRLIHILLNIWLNILYNHYCQYNSNGSWFLQLRNFIDNHIHIFRIDFLCYTDKNLNQTYPISNLQNICKNNFKLTLNFYNPKSILPYLLRLTHKYSLLYLMLFYIF